MSPGVYRLEALVYEDLIRMLGVSARKLGDAPLLPDTIIEQHVYPDEPGRTVCIFG